MSFREDWYSNFAFDSFLDEMPTNPSNDPTWECEECQGARMSSWETHCTNCGRRVNLVGIYASEDKARPEFLESSVIWAPFSGASLPGLSATESSVPGLSASGSSVPGFSPSEPSLLWVRASDTSEPWVPPVPSLTTFDQSSISTIPEIKESLEFSQVRIPRQRNAGYGEVESLLKTQASDTNQDDDCDTSNSIKATMAAPQMVYWFVNDLFGRLTSKGLIWDAQTIENASSLLPSLLNAFATKICFEDVTSRQLQAVSFFQTYKM